MRLVVKQDDRTVKEYQFAEGPIHIGRHTDNQVLLPDLAVSRKHAVISNTEDGEWFIEDLDSADKTYLNDRAIHKAEIKDGDCVRISDFTIEISLDADTDADKAISEKSASGTLVVDKPTGAKKTVSRLAHDAQIIARKPGAEKPPHIRFPGERAVDFLETFEALSKADSIDKVLLALLSVVTKQFDAHQVWSALRSEPTGPMTCHAGKMRGGRAIELAGLKTNEKISEAIEQEEFLLFVFSRVPGQEDHKEIRSILIAPIVSTTGCFGIVYTNNTFREDHYSLSDLDYLMLIAMHTATILEKF